MFYEYDFGDSWQHELRFEKVLPESEFFQATCVAEEGNCPPEDCGEAHGFAELLEALRNPSHPRHDEFVEFVGGAFDPELFASGKSEPKTATTEALNRDMRPTHKPECAETLSESLFQLSDFTDSVGGVGACENCNIW